MTTTLGSGPSNSENRAPLDSEVAAVVVTHFPDQVFREQLKMLVPQVGRIIVVDNSGAGVIDSMLSDFDRSIVNLISNETNAGLAAALNQGVVAATDLGYSHVLLLDQDSIPDAGMVAKLRQGFDLPQHQPVGVVGSNARTGEDGLVATRTASEAPLVEIEAVITSGSLLSADAFMKCGPFREDFFIEGIDLEYCLRLRKHGFHVLISSTPLLSHSFGSGRQVTLFGRKMIVSDHAQWRYFYMGRNLGLIIRQYGRDEKTWTRRALKNSLKTCVKSIVFEKHGIGNARAMIGGFWRGYMNKIERPRR
ncbi:MAG: glycosyltransferase family 2 protein [Actinomycetota bacterium]